MKKLRRPEVEAIFAIYQIQAGLPINSLLLDCDTQWGSLLTMLECASQHKQAMKLAEDNPYLGICAESKVTSYNTGYHLIGAHNVVNFLSEKSHRTGYISFRK